MSAARRSPASGLTLIELVVAMGLSTVVIGAILAFFMYTARAYRAGQTELRLQREGARALDEIAGAIRAAQSLSPADAVTGELAIETPAESYFFTTTGGRLVETVGSGTPEQFFDDPEIQVPLLRFTKLVDSSTGVDTTSGVRVELTLTHRLAPEPISTSTTVSLRDAAVYTPVAAPTPTPFGLPVPTPIPTLPTPIPPLPTEAPTPPPPPPTEVPLPTVPPGAPASSTSTPTAAPTATPTVVPPTPTSTVAVPTATPILVLPTATIPLLPTIGLP